jgi:hypothetical protein
MKSFTAVLSLFFLTALAACGHFSMPQGIQSQYIHDVHFEPSPLAAFLAVTENAAEQIAHDETLPDWQTSYDNAKHMSDLLPKEGLNDSQLKECDAIMEQMEMGKLAIVMKTADPRTGTKQCRLVSAEILRHIKKIKAMPKTKEITQAKRNLNLSGHDF